MREVDWRLKSINDRQGNDIKMNAKLHGFEVNLPSLNNSNNRTQLTKDQEKAMQIALEKAKERKRREVNHGR